MHMLGVESALDYPQNIPGLFKYVNIGSKQEEEGGPGRSFLPIVWTIKL